MRPLFVHLCDDNLHTQKNMRTFIHELYLNSIGIMKWSFAHNKHYIQGKYFSSQEFKQYLYRCSNETLRFMVRVLLTTEYFCQYENPQTDAGRHY